MNSIRSDKPQIAINTVSQWAVTFLNGVIGIFLVPFLILKLGREGYGIIGVIGSIVGISTLIDLGVSTSLSRNLAAALARNDIKEYNELVSTSLLCNTVAGLLAGVVLFILSGWLVISFRVPEEWRPTALWLFRIYGAGTIFLMLQAPIASAILSSHNRFDIVSMIQILNKLLVSISLFVILGLTSLGLAGWAVVSLIFTAASLVFGWWQAIKINMRLRVSLQHVRVNTIRHLYSLGWRVFVLNFSSQLNTCANPMVLTSLLGPASISLYSPATKVIGTFSPVVLTLVLQLHPVATNFHVKKSQVGLQATLIRGTRLTMLMGVLMCVVLAGFADFICKIWLENALGEQYRTVATVLVLSAVVSIISFSSSALWPVLLGMNKLGVLACIELPFAIINILGSIFIVGYTSLGVIGVLIPILITETVRRPIIFWYTAHVVKLRISDYLFRGFFRPLVVGTIILLLVYTLRLVLSLDRITFLAGACVGITFLWFILCWYIGFDKSDRLDLGNILIKVAEKIKVKKPR